MLLLSRFDPRLRAVVRLAGLALISWTVFHASDSPGTHGRGVIVGVTWLLCAVAWLRWTWRPHGDHPTVDTYVLAIAGGVLVGASPSSAGSVFVLVAVATASLRNALTRASLVTALGSLAVAISVIVYDRPALGLLAYVLGFVAISFAASNARQSLVRAEQAELLLAQTQRSHEEQLRTARLQESTRIARDIHDVLAHALAGLTIQLEATAALIEQDADRDRILERVRRAHELAREGLRETRRAVGALRGDDAAQAPSATPVGVEALVREYRSRTDAAVTLTLDGDAARLSGDAGQTILRTVQESLTNVSKHAPGAAVTITIHAGQGEATDGAAAAGGDTSGGPIELTVVNGPARAAAATAGAGPASTPGGLAATGGGYGLRGMRERAQALGGSLGAGPTGDGGWQVRLELPGTNDPAAVVAI